MICFLICLFLNQNVIQRGINHDLSTTQYYYSLSSLAMPSIMAPVCEADADTIAAEGAEGN